MKERISVEIKEFNQLSKEELYRILQLRAVVFIQEQNAPYLDPDNKDLLAAHLMLKTENNRIIGYARLCPPDSYFKGSTCIGRVVSDPEYRRKGLGYIIMEEAVKYMKKNFPEYPVEISAQTYLIKFYQSFGFMQISNQYLEDGLPHVGMKLYFK